MAKPPQTVKRHGKLLDATLEVVMLKEGKIFVAYVPALDLSTCGDTFEEARANLDEALSAFFEEIGRRGTLRAALTELGWNITDDEMTPPQIIANSSVDVRIPLPA